ncbi:MAG TPA: tRNA (N6-threonylcarbamoyladenosine(37)-N6)-methyltransferase TrmO [Tissierellia bacterium]|nr:tRNA (N6-threonylcarbamoyladenosine(37)-N6)-methyltransferase TrmO [Tissierellia bacterium]
MDIIMRPIGLIRSPFKHREELRLPPCHPDAPYHDPKVTATIELEPEFCDGIKDIEPGSYGLLVFYFDQSSGYQMITRSHGQDRDHVGVFSTRSPHRPNGIGTTIVKFVAIEGCRLTFQGVDMLDGTPLLDIKPHSGEKIFD